MNHIAPSKTEHKRPGHVAKLDGPHAVDVHVGGRVRLRRTLLGLSQEKLGEAVGVTFQQVQKYERGANRVSASMLWKVAQALDVPISFFFDGLDDRPNDDALTNDDLRVLVAFNKLEPKRRAAVVNFMEEGL